MWILWILWILWVQGDGMGWDGMDDLRGIFLYSLFLGYALLTLEWGSR